MTHVQQLTQHTLGHFCLFCWPHAISMTDFTSQLMTPSFGKMRNHARPSVIALSFYCSCKITNQFTRSFSGWTRGSLCKLLAWCCPLPWSCRRPTLSRVYCSDCERSQWKLIPVPLSMAQPHCQPLPAWHQLPPYAGDHTYSHIVQRLGPNFIYERKTQITQAL